MEKLIRKEWLDAVPMRRVIIHWTAGGHTPSDVDRKHYHFLVDNHGRVYPGVPVSRNSANRVKPGYAAHTLNCNTGSIGVSLCGMAGAIERPFSAGDYPITLKQLNIACECVAELCKHYGIAVTPKTVLTHAEVQTNLGIRQRGKWDIAVFPWAASTYDTARYDTARECGDYIRAKVMGVTTHV